MAGLSRLSKDGVTAAPPWAATVSRRVLPPLARAGAALARRVLMLAILIAAVFAAVELLPGDAANATSERGTAPRMSRHAVICSAWTGPCGNASPTG